MAFDTKLFELIHGLSGHHAWLDGLGVFLAHYLPHNMIVGLIILTWYLYKGRERVFFIVQTVLIMILSRGIITETIRFFIHRARPFAALGFTPMLQENPMDSFPSGHMTAFFALAMAVYFMHRRWGILFLVLAAINGIARIYAGVHYPTDIIGGILIAILSALLVRKLLEPYRVMEQKAEIAEKINVQV